MTERPYEPPHEQQSYEPQYPHYTEHPQYSRYDQQAYTDHGYRSPYAAAPVPAPVSEPLPESAGTGRSLGIGIGVALVLVALVLGGVALTSGPRTVDGAGALAQPNLPVQPADPSNPSNPGSGGQTQPGNGSTSRSGTANATQQIGIVTILSTLKYQNAQSAGTGMILSSDGKVLTNNHVIRGATSIDVTVESTGRTYPAKVVGTAPGSDVAMIKMTNASGLRTAKFAASAKDVQVGDAIVGVGNGGGTGRLTAAAGKVTALNQSITASDENGQDSERLTGLIQVNAKIISGDSGGPLYDAKGEIVGMDTAASASRRATPIAYAIPIENARSIVDQIDSGVETAQIRIGYPGFLGVTTRAATSGQGASVYQVVPDGPADDAGIKPGDVITSADGVRTTSPQQLSTQLKKKDPGARVKISWTDQTGNAQSATVTLITGPAD